VAGVTLAVLSAILKEIYEGEVREQLNNDVVALRRIEKSSAGITSEVGGKYVTFPVHYGRNGGIGARRENEDLPLAGNQSTAAARVGLKYQYGSLQLTGQSLELADSNTQAFISALNLEKNGLTNDLAKDLNRQVYGNGNGQMAVTSTVGAANTATITKGMQYMNVGDVIDIYTAANLAADAANGKAAVGGVQVTAVNASAGTITFNGAAITLAAGDIIVRYGAQNREWTGLNAIVQNSGTLYNIDPNVVDKWRATVDANGGTARPLTESMIIKNVDAARVNGCKTSLLLTTLGVRRSYFSLLVQQREFVNTSQDNKSFEGGFVGLAFTTDAGEIPLISDVDAPLGILWGIDESHIKMYRDADWSFMSRDGSMWQRVNGTAAQSIRDAYSATNFQYSELGTDRRGGHFQIQDLIEG
jgi:hypothetical protein